MDQKQDQPSEEDREDIPRMAGATHVQKGLSIRVVGAIALLLTLAACVYALVSVRTIINTNKQATEDNSRYTTCERAIGDLKEASEYLTNQSRMYVMTGDRYYLDTYLEELYQVDRRGKAVEVLKKELSSGEETLPLLVDALWQSNALAQTELYALRLAAQAYNLDHMPGRLAEVNVGTEDAGLSNDELKAKAKDLLLNESYARFRTRIDEDVEEGTVDLINSLQDKRMESDRLLDERLSSLQVTTTVLLLIACFLVLVIFLFVLSPIAAYERHILADEPLEERGGRELRNLAIAYNAMYEANQNRTELLQHAAEHDPLTGLRNRGAFDALTEANASNSYALVLIDVDNFKQFNDQYGHGIGDAVLKRVARAIQSSFRSTDHPCRIGGDEFAVIMSGVSESMREPIVARVESLRASLAECSDGVPSVTLSIGVAFSEPDEDSQQVYREADEALYRVKERGRNGYAFHGEASGEH